MNNTAEERLQTITESGKNVDQELGKSYQVLKKCLRNVEKQFRKKKKKSWEKVEQKKLGKSSQKVKKKERKR